MAINLKKRKSNGSPPPVTPAVSESASKTAVLPELAAEATIAPEGIANQALLADTPEPAAKPAPRSSKRERERKTERMDIRVTPTVKDFVQDVMDASGFTAGDLLLLGARGMLGDLETRIEVDRAPYTRLKIHRRSSEVAPDR